MFSVPYIGKAIDAYVYEVIAPGEKDPWAVFNAFAASSGSNGLEIDLRDPVRRAEGTRAMIARAVMEGAARLLKEQLDRLRDSGFVFEEAVMAGGASHSPVWPEIIENITGLRLRKGTAHSGARGAAILAGIGAGVYRDEFDAYEKTGRAISGSHLF
jgi:sugar (pentulose or hexulose) kinase